MMVSLSSPMISNPNLTMSSDLSSYECPVGALDAFNGDLAKPLSTRKILKSTNTYISSLLSYFSMLPTKHLRLKIPVILSRNGRSLHLTDDHDTPAVCKVDVRQKRICVERVEI